MHPFHVLNPVDATVNSYCIAAVSDVDGAPVIILPGCNQDSTFPDANTTWTLTPFMTGPIRTFTNKCLNSPNGVATNGAKLQIRTCFPGNTNQLFFRPFAAATFELAGTGKCLDVTDGIVSPGTPVRY